jgi:hypothetical protein
MKAHGLLERDGKRYAYRLTEKGTKVALTFVLFHKQLCAALPTACFTTSRTARNGPTASSKPPTIKPTHPSPISFNYLRQLKFCWSISIYD